MKLLRAQITSIRRLLFVATSLLAVANGSGLADDAAAYKLPQFRKVQVAAKVPAFPEGTLIHLLADANFPPYSFQARSGAPVGLAVDLGMAACAEIKITCDVVLKPLGELLPALASHQGDVIVSGPRIDEKALEQAVLTRAWFRSFGRFAVQSGNPLKASDARGLAGKRIGTVEGTAHAAWISTYYAEAELLTFATSDAAQDALRTGAVDTIFDDNLRMIYWIAGANSRNCCKLLGGAYMDFESFSRNAAFLIRSDRVELRDAFDVALDRLQTNGTTEKLFNVYLPLNPW